MIDRRVVPVRWFPKAAVMIGIAVLVVACAEPKPPNAFEEAFNDETKTWHEIETQLPPQPVTADLIDFKVSGATEYRFAIDRKALTIGTDGVFRYTLIATSPSGVRNVTYEGIRCDVAQRKIYAIGRPDGSWVRARNAAWIRIEEVGNNRQHAALMKEYFCPDSYASRSVDEIIGRLKVHLPSTIL